MLIKIVCSWCGRPLGFKKGENADLSGIPEPISHSICPECKEKALAELQSIPIDEINPTNK
jgi:hypothetical protein